MARPAWTARIIALVLALAVGVVAGSGCETSPDGNRDAPPDHYPPDNNYAVDPGGPFNGEVAGRRSESLPPLTREQYRDFMAARDALQQGDHAACVSLLQPMVDNGRDDEWLLNNLGTALIPLGRAEDALDVLRRGLDRYPDNGFLHYNHARALEHLGRATEAIPHFQAYLASDLVDEAPERTRDAIARMGDALRRDGRIDECVEALELGRQRFPGSPLFVEGLAEIAWDRGDTDRFRELAAASVELLEASLGNDADAVESQMTATGNYRLPLRRPVVVRRGPESRPGHFGARLRFAVDLLPLSDDLHARPDHVPLLGSDVREWFGFGAEVVAARDGEVIYVDDAHPDQSRTGVPDDLVWLLPNRIRIRHDNGELSEYVHLQQGSASVAAGDSVRAGQVIARVGCSGMRPVVPHLGFRVARETPDGLHPGLRFTFHDLERHDPEAGAWSAIDATLPAVDTVVRAASSDDNGDNGDGDDGE